MSIFFRNNNGFTLIEVMVALAIFAVAASMLMLSGGSNIKKTRYLQEKISAGEVADQYLNKLYMAHLPLIKGSQQYLEHYLKRDWHVRETVRDTEIPNMYQVTVDVFVDDSSSDNKGQYQATLTTLLRNPIK